MQNGSKIVERLREYTPGVGPMEEAAAKVERLRAALEAARDALRNDFEPDNQSRAYKAADAALRASR